MRPAMLATADPVLADVTTPTPVQGRQRLRFTPKQHWALHDQGMLPTLSELVDGEIIAMPAQHVPAVRAIRRFD